MDSKSPQKSQSPIKISLHNLDKISYQVKESWKTKGEEFEKLFGQFVSYYKNQNPQLNIKFTCAISGEPLDDPVSFMQCVVEKKHLNDCFDLKQLLKYLISNDPNFMKEGYLQCPICRAKSPIKKDIPLIPNIFFQQLQQQLGYKPKPIIYLMPTSTIVPVYTGQLGKEQPFYLTQIQSVVTLQSDQHQAFNTLRKQNKGNESFKYSHLCLLSQLRIQIPVRSVHCHHIECYDFLYLHWFMTTKDINQFICLYVGCQANIKLSELSLDSELYEIGLKSYSFSSDFVFDSQSQQLLDTYSITNYDPHIAPYKKLVPSTTESIQYLKDIFNLAERIYSSTKSQEFTDKFYEHPLSGDIDIQKHPTTNCRVEIPCRCIRCDKMNVCDLRYMCCILYQVEHPDNRNGVKEFQIACPLCKNQFAPKKRHRDQSVFEQVYIDTKMLSYIMTIKNFNNLNKEKYLLFLQGKLFPSLKYEEVESPLLNFSQCKMNLKCLLTSQQLKNPIRGVFCNHPEAFEETAIVKMIQNGQMDPNISTCPKCQQSIHKVTHDYLLKEIISTYVGDSDNVLVVPKSKSMKSI